ncbi:MAG: hypothetical protein P8H59_02940 [Flavobacteriales bacterium]|nr:hypothetical protein [Flavobacteriales bacterium]MDG1779881.1 hypothetical protein [Flavobacteriales bacterium]MDG2245873.1 hypothetical protein [Flavobacteriales bacterium]
MNTTRNIYAYVLAAIVAVISVFGLLGIWEIIQWEDFREFFWKGLYSLILLFVSAGVIMFIFSAIYKAPVKPPVSPFSRDGESKEAA